MKKIRIILLICLYILAVGLMGSETDRYETYTAVNYHLNLYEFEKAEQLIDAYLEKYPDDPFLLTEKAYLLKNIKNQHQEALKLLKKTQTIYPGYYYSNYLYASLLFLYRDAHQPLGLEKNISTRDEALKYLEISIKDNDKFYDSLFLMGVLLSDKGEYKNSNLYLEKAAALKQTAEPYFYTAHNYSQLKDIENEIRAYEKVLDFNPYNSQALNAISHHYLKQGDAKKAAVYLERLFLKYPDDQNVSFDYLKALFAAREMEKFLEVSETMDISGLPILMFARAFFLAQKERYAEAVELLTKSNKNDLKTNLLLADIYQRKKDYFHAYQALKDIDDKEKNYLFYSMHLEILSLLDMNQQIIKVFGKIKDDSIIMEEFSLRDYYNVIFAYSNLNRLEPLPELMQRIKTGIKSKEESEALEELNRALTNLSKGIEINADDIGSNINRYLIINSYKKQKKYAPAVSLLKRLIKKEKDPGFYIELADSYVRQKESKKAETLLEEMRNMFPASIEIKNFYAYFLALENRELEKALKLSRDTLAEEGESPAFLDTCGYILFRMGRYEEALGFLEKAYQKNPFEPEIMEHLADYYRLKKNTGKVIEIYRRAIDNEVDFKHLLMEKMKKLITGQPQKSTKDTK